MATRALAAAVAGQSGFLALASSRRGGAQNNSRRSNLHAQAGEERSAGHGASASESTVTAAQVEAALNRKNVDELPQDLGSRAATVLPDEAVADADSDAASWVPDQETGVFVPAESAASDGPSAASVLDQTVFVRDEEMQDVEGPAVDAK